MPHFIQHIIEPDELLLSWQAPGNKDRMRRFVGKAIRRQDTAAFEYLRESPDFDKARELGFRGYPGLSLDKPHDDVLPIFTRRLPPRSRQDIRQYVQGFGIEHEDQVSNFALLGYSGGRLPGDEFSFVHPFTNASPPVDLWTEACGYRFHQAQVPYVKIKPGDPVCLHTEPSNPMDPNAIALEYKGARIGYVNRGLAPKFHSWINNGISVKITIERKNGNAERPFIFLYVEVRSQNNGDGD